jgi:hypothetical protein
MTLLGESDWAGIERLRGNLGAQGASTVEEAAQGFATTFFETFTSVVLTRVFMVVPFAQLPARERAFAMRVAGEDPRLRMTTPVLVLLGTRGRESAWNDRTCSSRHLCIPLVDRTFVEAAPMVAKLLADIDVDLAALDDGRPIVTRRLLGGKNGMFYVPDAATAMDGRGRSIIADRDFVAQYDIHTVFGMGGAYIDGSLVISIVFATEKLDRFVVDRFPSLIGSFKIATAPLVGNRSIFNEAV